MSDTVFNTVPDAALADELEVVDAIYGQGSINVALSDSTHTCVELRLPEHSYRFLLRFPSAYPDQAPTITGIDSLQLSIRPEIQEQISFLRISLLLVYCPGQICLYDLVEKYAEISQMKQNLEGKGISQLNHQVVIRFDKQMKRLARRARAAFNHGRNVGWYSGDQVNLLSTQIIECAVCLDPCFKLYAATLSCKHSFCVECLQEGLTSMMAGNGEFKCCGKYITLPLVQRFSNFEPDTLHAYATWLNEASSGNPLYCCLKTCSAFIPTYLFRNALAKCTKCSTVTCITCRGRQHVGLCGYELKKISNLAKANKWKFCPSCSHLVERTFGCSHMLCVCGERFCYECGRAQKDCVC